MKKWTYFFGLLIYLLLLWNPNISFQQTGSEKKIIGRFSNHQKKRVNDNTMSVKTFLSPSFIAKEKGNDIIMESETGEIITIDKTGHKNFKARVDNNGFLYTEWEGNSGQKKVKIKVKNNKLQKNDNNSFFIKNSNDKLIGMASEIRAYDESDILIIPESVGLSAEDEIEFSYSKNVKKFDPTWSYIAPTAGAYSSLIPDNVYANTTYLWVGSNDPFSNNGYIVTFPNYPDSMAGINTITACSLYVYAYQNFYPPKCPGNTIIKRVSESCTISALTFNNKPDSATPWTDTVYVDANVAKWYAYDIKEIMQGVLDGTYDNYGVEVNYDTLTVINSYINFASETYGTVDKRLYLISYYTDPKTPSTLNIETATESSFVLVDYEDLNNDSSYYFYALWDSTHEKYITASGETTSSPVFLRELELPDTIHGYLGNQKILFSMCAFSETDSLRAVSPADSDYTFVADASIIWQEVDNKFQIDSLYISENNSSVQCSVQIQCDWNGLFLKSTGTFQTDSVVWFVDDIDGSQIVVPDNTKLGFAKKLLGINSVWRSFATEYHNFGTVIDADYIDSIFNAISPDTSIIVQAFDTTGGWTKRKYFRISIDTTYIEP